MEMNAIANGWAIKLLPSGGTLGELGTISVVDDASSPAFSIPLSDKSSPSTTILCRLLLRNSRFNSLNEPSDESMSQLCSTVIFSVSFKSLGFGLQQRRQIQIKWEPSRLLSLRRIECAPRLSTHWQPVNSRLNDPLTSSELFPLMQRQIYSFHGFLTSIIPCNPPLSSATRPLSCGTEASSIMSYDKFSYWFLKSFPLKRVLCVTIFLASVGAEFCVTTKAFLPPARLLSFDPTPSGLWAVGLQFNPPPWLIIENRFSDFLQVFFNAKALPSNWVNIYFHILPFN